MNTLHTTVLDLVRHGRHGAREIATHLGLPERRIVCVLRNLAAVGLIVKIRTGNRENSWVDVEVADEVRRAVEAMKMDRMRMEWARENERRKRLRAAQAVLRQARNVPRSVFEHREAA